jgi:hypothetical protein
MINRWPEGRKRGVILWCPGEIPATKNKLALTTVVEETSMCTRKIILGIALVLFSWSVDAQQAEKWELRSPDGAIRFVVSLKKNGAGGKALQYEVASVKQGESTPVIEASPLGIRRADQQFAENLSFVAKTAIKTIDEKYRMLIGRQTEARNHARELGLTFKNNKGALLQVVLRAYNDGVAFRYVFPERSGVPRTVKEELTGFNLPDNGKLWAQRFDKPHRSCTLKTVSR